MQHLIPPVARNSAPAYSNSNRYTTVLFTTVPIRRNIRAGTRVSSVQGDPMNSGFLTMRCFPLLAAVLCLSACEIHSAHSSPAQYDAQSVEMDASELVHVNLHMGAGDLRVTDGSQKLMRADFTYSVPEWKPEVRYTSSSGRGVLTIEQPKSTRAH